MAQELKSYSVVASSETQNYLDGEINLAFEAYDADEVDAVLAEKDAEIRRLKRALWIARAKRAIEKIAWFKLWNASISTMNPEDGARQEYDKWKKNLGKFLKKAEVYR